MPVHGPRLVQFAPGADEETVAEVAAPLRFKSGALVKPPNSISIRLHVPTNPAAPNVEAGWDPRLEKSKSALIDCDSVIEHVEAPKKNAVTLLIINPTKLALPIIAMRLMLLQPS